MYHDNLHDSAILRRISQAVPHAQHQRDSRVAESELPWVYVARAINSEGAYAVDQRFRKLSRKYVSLERELILATRELYRHRRTLRTTGCGGVPQLLEYQAAKETVRSLGRRLNRVAEKLHLRRMVFASSQVADRAA